MSQDKDSCCSGSTSCCDGSESVTEVSHKQADDIRQQVRESYARVAQADNSGEACGIGSSCCGVSDDDQINTLISTRLGYSEDDLTAVPEGADMGLGCGNPRAIASLKLGEVVVDLGSGGGFDAFLAAAEVGTAGRVIGVDMTPDMISKARSNAEKGRFEHVEFRLGEIENLPVANDTVDVIISNCVINLSPNKSRVFEEAFRVLKPGGRLAISDVVATVDLPQEMRDDLALYSGCMAGASQIEELESHMQNAGFSEIRIAPKDESRDFIKDWAPGRGVEAYVVSATIEATKA